MEPPAKRIDSRPKATGINLSNINPDSQFLQTIQASISRQFKARMTPADRTMALRHMGIITNRVVKYWYWKLPASVWSYYSEEDMIAEIVLHVVRKAHLFDRRKGKESTLIWTIVDNKCRSIISYYNTKKRNACETLPLLEDLVVTLPDATPDSVRYRDALDAVETVIAYASDAVLDLIDLLLHGNFNYAAQVSADTMAEMKRLADQHHATLDDFMLIMKYVREAR